MKNMTILAVVFILFALITGCSKPPASIPPFSSTPSVSGSPGVQTSEVFAKGKATTPQNSFAISCPISFEDKTRPVRVVDPRGGHLLYEFKNLKMSVTIKGKTSDFPAFVRWEWGIFHLGTVITLAGNISDYGKVDRIVFKSDGYKDVEFTDQPIINNFVKLQPVVIKK